MNRREGPKRVSASGSQWPRYWWIYTAVPSRLTARGEGRGAEFTIRLPLIAETGVPQGRRVLVVDDNPDHRVLLAELLRERGYEVIEAQDASEAQLISGQKADACMIDIGLPGMDGVEVLD